MINLLSKDFKVLLGKEKSPSKRVISAILSVSFTILLVIIEVVVFNIILNSIATTKPAPIAYINLFLFVISMITIISGIMRANRLFFNEKDIEQLVVRPVSNAKIILSKLLFLFITHYVSTIVFVYPLLISYSTHFHVSGLFFYLGVFYPVLTFLFEIGISLLLVYPIWLFGKYLKKHFILRFVIILSILVIGCIIYAKVLDVFMNILTGGNIQFLKSDEVINTLLKIRKYTIPNRFIVDAYFLKMPSRILPYLAISLGVFVAGLSVCIFAFNYVRNFAISIKQKPREHDYKVMSVKKALVKKEFNLLTKNADYTVSFVGLLIVQPFLVYLVIKVLNQLFRGEMFAGISLVIPNFTTLLDVLIVLLFTLIISQGANEYIGMEKKTIKVMKIIPVDPVLQLMIKVMIPFSMSVVSLLLTVFVLSFTKTLTFVPFIFAFLLALLLLFIFTVISLKEELSIRHHKPRSTFMSSLYSYVLPIAYFGLSILLAYFKLPLVVTFILGIVLIIGLGIYHVLYLKKNMRSLFMDLDVEN